MPKDILLACDYGALEARTIAMSSRDANLVRYLWDRKYDIHQVWADKIIKIWSSTYEKRGSDRKGFRSDTKNQLVFPKFYGAQAPSVCRSLEMPFEIYKPLDSEFEEEFKGVFLWHKDVLKFYREHFYVETLTGFRRFGPMSNQMAINSIPQGTGSDIVVDAMTRLARLAFEMKKPWLAACLNVHDDLTFRVPVIHLGEAIPIIVHEMTSTSFDFVNVPLAVEMSAGWNWHEMEEVGKFFSHTLESDFKNMKQPWLTAA